MKKLIILLSIITLYSCEIRTTDMNGNTDQDYKEVIDLLRKENISLKEKNLKLEKELKDKKISYKIWDSYDVSLPQGRILQKDYSHLKDGGSDLTDNYVSIKQTNGLSIIKRDIDVDTYLNLSVGDSIQ